MNQQFKNLNKSNDRVMRSLSFSPLPLESEDIEDNATVRGYSYSMRDALFPGQDKRVNFDNDNNGVHDQPTAHNYHQKTLNPSRSQGN